MSRLKIHPRGWLHHLRSSVQGRHRCIVAIVQFRPSAPASGQACSSCSCIQWIRGHIGQAVWSHCNRKLSEDAKVDGGIRFRVGLWTAEEEEESSNYKELKKWTWWKEKQRGEGCVTANFSCLQITPLPRVVFIEGTHNLGTCMPLFSS